MQKNGWTKTRIKAGRKTDGQIKAIQRLEHKEVRGFESAYVHALWHLDFHHGRRIVDNHGNWHTPKALCILDDRSRLCCHIQWYLDETAETLIHGLSQAFYKRGLPRSLMSDNGSAMMAAELREGLARLGIVHELTLPYSPEQNAKQEAFWGNVEGRLMPMLEGHEPLTLSVLNTATVAWLTQEYHNKVHRELGCSPFERLRQASDVSRPSPRSDALTAAFRTEVPRKPRRSDGTLSLAGQRYEIPSRYRHLSKVNVRYARWDLSAVDMVDPDAGTLLCPLYPLDKAANADGRRRHLETPDIAPSGQPCGMAPLLKEMIAAYAATGLPPAYLPSDEELAP
jgi:transposase InsO family protein